MSTNYDPVEIVENAIENRIGLISSSMTAYEMSDATAFIKEAKQLRDTLVSLDYYGEKNCDFDYENYSDVSGEDFVNAYVQACDMLIILFKLLDDKKVKETKSEWIFDDLRDFIDMSKAAFGNRIPDLPIMRVVSASTRNKK